MSARAPFKNLCPRERTRLPMLKESASPLLPLRGDSCSNAMFPPGTAVGPKPPRTAPAYLRRAVPRQSRSFPERPSFLRFRPPSFLLAVVRPAASFRSSPPCSSSPSARALPRGSPFPAAIPSLGPDFSLPRLSHASPWFHPPSAPCASSFFPRPIFPRPIFPRPCLARS